MNKLYYFIVFIFFFGQKNAVYAQHETTTNEQKLYKVDSVEKKFTDLTRMNFRGTGPRTIRTTIWYPSAENTAKEKNSTSKKTKKISLAGERNKYPLILVSHGSGGSSWSMNWLSTYLARRGYIVASVSHKGDSTEEVDMGALLLSDQHLWERPRDLTSVLDKILDDKDFKSKIDVNRIGAAGFSAGGYTVIALAGAKINLEKLKISSPYYKNPDLLPPYIRQSIEDYLKLLEKDSILQASFARAEESHKDKRIKGVFALAPAIGEGFDERGMEDVNIPVRIVVGDNDVVTPKETNAMLYKNGIKGSDLIVMPGEIGHLTIPQTPENQQNKLEQVSNYAFQFFENLWKR